MRYRIEWTTFIGSPREADFEDVEEADEYADSLQARDIPYRLFNVETGEIRSEYEN